MIDEEASNMSVISNFIAAQTKNEKSLAICALEGIFGQMYEPEFGENISKSSEWNKELQYACLDRYQKNREEYLAQINTMCSYEKMMDFSELALEEEDPSFNYGLVMIFVVENIGGNLENIMDRAIILAKCDDSEMKGCGSTLLLRGQKHLSQRFCDVLDIMTKQGTWGRPFKIGQAFNYLIDSDPALSLEAAKCLGHSKEDNLVHSILLALADRNSIPDVFDEHISRMVKKGVGKTKSLALLAVSVKPSLAKALEEDILLALSAKEWYIRGHAAEACGCAELSPSRFLPQLSKLISDWEGHDWSPAESAIKAISQYGPIAMETLPAIKAAIKEWLTDDGEEEDEFVLACREAIASITSS